jgi:hypothetical protein
MVYAATSITVHATVTSKHTVLMDTTLVWMRAMRPCPQGSSQVKVGGEYCVVISHEDLLDLMSMFMSVLTESPCCSCWCYQVMLTILLEHET